MPICQCGTPSASHSAHSTVLRNTFGFQQVRDRFQALALVTWGNGPIHPLGSWLVHKTWLSGLSHGKSQCPSGWFPSLLPHETMMRFSGFSAPHVSPCLDKLTHQPRANLVVWVAWDHRNKPRENTSPVVGNSHWKFGRWWLSEKRRMLTFIGDHPCHPSYPISAMVLNTAQIVRLQQPARPQEMGKTSMILILSNPASCASLAIQPFTLGMLASFGSKSILLAMMRTRILGFFTSSWKKVRRKGSQGHLQFLHIFSSKMRDSQPPVD